MTGQHLRDLPAFLRAPRAAGLWLIGVLIAVATVWAFAASYHGLFDWAIHHQWPAVLAAGFPLLVDLLIVVPEVILFVAAIDGDTPRRVRILAWVTLLVFTAGSVVANADHIAVADWPTRAGFGLPPLVLAIALGFGLGELKRQAAKYRAAPRTVSSPVFTDAQTAALAAYERTAAAGNPLSQNKLAAQFRLSRAEARDVIERGDSNGEGQQNSDPGRQRPGREADQDSRRGRHWWQRRQRQVAASSERSRGGSPTTPAPAAQAPAGVALAPAAPAGALNGKVHGV